MGATPATFADMPPLAKLLWIAAKTIVTIVVGGVWLMLVGLTPQEWLVALIGEPPEWLSHPLTRIGIIIGGLVIIGRLLLWQRRTRPITTASPSWIRIADAPFEIPKRPNLPDEIEFWGDNMLQAFLAGSTSQEPPTPNMPFNPSVPSMRDLDGRELVYCGIDWERRSFVWTWSRNGKSHGFGMPPSDIIALDRPVSWISDEVWKAIQSRTRFTWQLMEDPVSEMIYRGHLTVWARRGSPAAPFSSLPHDSWQHFRVVDWHTGEAATDSGERLYSVYVEPTAPTILMALRTRFSEAKKGKMHAAKKGVYP
jgi:hypothetical protein